MLFGQKMPRVSLRLDWETAMCTHDSNACKYLCSNFCCTSIYLASWSECLACEIDNVTDNVPVGCLAWNIYSKIHWQLLQWVNSLQINMFSTQWTTHTREVLVKFSVYGDECLVWHVYDKGCSWTERAKRSSADIGLRTFVLFYGPNNKSNFCDIKISLALHCRSQNWSHKYLK